MGPRGPEPGRPPLRPPGLVERGSPAAPLPPGGVRRLRARGDADQPSPVPGVEVELELDIMNCFQHKLESRGALHNPPRGSTGL